MSGRSPSRDLECELVVVAHHLAQGTGGQFEPAHVGKLQADMSAGDAAFELIGGPLGNQLPLIEHCDPVGELVRFLQVLRGEQDRYTAGHEVADDLPHRVALRGSRPVVGSSRKMMRGLPTRVIARSSRRRIPPE